MDSSTITFIATLVIAFIFLRWFISSDEADEQAQEAEITANGNPETTQASQSSSVRYRRPVTNDMIEVVQQLAPSLTVGQIKLDLERTGSVQETVDRFLSEGSLPFPQGQTSAVTTAAATDNGADTRNSVNNIRPENLLKKYNVDSSSAATSGSSTKGAWSTDANERATSLQQKKAEMILKARARLESQLKNEQDLSGLKEN